jgi:hypothetical protein
MCVSDYSCCFVFCLVQAGPVWHLSNAQSPVGSQTESVKPGMNFFFFLERSSRAEVCANVKRDLFVWEKRPICMGKETYLYGKRDLSTLQTRPTNLLAYLTYAHVSKERIHTSL